MSWDIRAARDAFPSFATEWDRLNHEIYDANPMFDSRFVGPLLECFGNGSERLCIHTTGTALDGAVLLRPSGFGRWELFLPSQAQIAPLLLRDAAHVQTLMGALPGCAWSIDLLAQDPDFSLDWTPLHLPRIVMQHNLTMSIETDGDFEAYWRSRPPQLRKNINRYEHRADSQVGGLTTVTITRPEEILDAVTRYGTLESAGWKGKNGTAVCIDNIQGRFYLKTLQAFAAAGHAMVIELRTTDTLAASRLLIKNRQRWIILKTTYDETLAAIAPGRLLLVRLLQQAFSAPDCSTVEFYTNATRDQTDWATSLRYIRHHQILRSEPLVGLVQLVRRSRSARNRRTDAQTVVNPVTTRGHRSIREVLASHGTLFEDTKVQCPEFSAEWFENLEQTVFAGDPGIRYYTSSFSDAPKAILPVRLTGKGAIRSVEALGNYYTSLYAPVLAPDATALDLIPLIEAATGDHGGAHMMRFGPMDPDSVVYPTLLTALRSSGWVPFRFFCFGNWYLKVDYSWKTYLEQRNGPIRNIIKRKGRKFAAAGGTLEIVTAPGDVERAVEAFIAVYSHSWKKPEPYPQFVPGLIRWLAAKGWLRLGIARLEGLPVAGQIWIVAHGKASIFKMAYDDAFSDYASGTLLTAHLMEHAIDRDRVREIDYLIGDDPYKKSWMSHRRERWGILAFNPRTAGGLALLATEAMRRIASRLFHRVPANRDATTSELIWRFFPASEFSALAPRWQALCDATIGSPLLSADFLETALRHFGHGDELICLAERSGETVAGVILRKKNLFAWQTFQPSQMPLGPWLQRPQENLAMVATSLLRQLPGVALFLAVTQLDSDFYPKEDADGLMAVDSITTGRVLLAPDMETFMGTGAVKENAKLAAELMRRMRKAEKSHGTIALKVETAQEDATDFVNRYAAIESRSWKAAGGSAIAPDDAQARFYADLMQRSARTGAARMYTLKFGDIAVAHQIAIAKNGVLVLLKTTYDPDFRSLGPGVIQTYHIIKDAIAGDRDNHFVEMYGRFNDSQKLWVAETRTIYHANVYRSHLLTSLHHKWITLRSRKKA